MEIKQNNSARWYASLGLMLAIMIATLFCKWLGVGDYQATLPKIADLLSTVARYSDGSGGGITLLKVLIYAALAVSTICGIVTLRSLVHTREKSAEVSEAGFVSAIVLSVLVILAILILNASLQHSLSDYFYIFGGNVFTLSFAPFCVLAAGIGGCVLCEHMTPESQDVKPTRKMHAATEKNYCPKCKKHVDAHGKYCTVCGTELTTDTIVCPQCGAVVPRGVAFCPNCAQDMSAHSDADDYHCEYCGSLLSAEAIQKFNLKYCPECGIAIGVGVEQLYKCGGSCPVCGNTRMLSAFCPACGHVIPEEIFETADTPS